MAPLDEFVFTVSDSDDLQISDLEDLDQEPPLKANIGRKRKRDGHSAHEDGKAIKKAKIGGISVQAEFKSGRRASEDTASDEDSIGLQDGAIDSDFEFDIGHIDRFGAVEDFDGWEDDTRVRKHVNSTASGNKRAVDIDDIIARRRDKMEAKDKEPVMVEDRGIAEDNLEIERELERGGYEDEDEDADQEGATSLEHLEDDTLAADGFGAGAHSEEEAESQSESDGIENIDENTPQTDIARNGHDADDSDSDSAASPTAHPDDLASDDAASSAETEPVDEAEATKRAAFFAPEDTAKAEQATLSSVSESFQSFSLSRPLLKGVAAVNYAQPTPIQKRTIPIALLGKDVVGSAVTGSGKTAAFLLPILERLVHRPRKIPTTRVAIMLPTRELAVQCYNVATQLAQFTDITFVQLVGGFSLREQEGLLKRRPDVVIATPGRFIDHMRNSASFVVEHLEILVLDEADRMLEDGFADELDEILKTIPRGRQTMLFSATMTESVDKLVRVGMNKPVRVSVDASRGTVKELVQEFVRLRPGREEKRMASLALLCTEVYKERAIVFFRQKKEVHRARIIFGLLGLKVGELHGGMSQEQRINAVSSFRSGKTTHLLATDLASRGLDIKNVLTVINFEAPQSHEIYLHRVGRTARAGQSGRACTIAAEPDRKAVKAAVKNARAQGAKIVSRAFQNAEVDAMDSRLKEMEPEVEVILAEEQEEKQLAQADMQLTRGHNLVQHEDEIKSRPKRTWFETEADKRVAKKAGRAELNGPESVKRKKKKLSGKDKKRLDGRKERTEGKVWRKGKGSEDAVKAERREMKQKSKRSAGGSKSKSKPRKR